MRFDLRGGYDCLLDAGLVQADTLGALRSMSVSLDKSDNLPASCLHLCSLDSLAQLWISHLLGELNFL